jgi:hypothetical protein
MPLSSPIEPAAPIEKGGNPPNIISSLLVLPALPVLPRLLPRLRPMPRLMPTP